MEFGRDKGWGRWGWRVARVNGGGRLRCGDEPVWKKVIVELKAARGEGAGWGWGELANRGDLGGQNGGKAYTPNRGGWLLHAQG